MGTFVTNLHACGADRHAVIDALRSLNVVPAYVRGSPDNTWTSIFPEAADQDRPVIAFIVHDSDIFLYWLCDSGKELDRYNSAPGFFTGEDMPPEGGNPDKLTLYCPSGLSTDRLSRLLHLERKKVALEATVKEAVRKKLRQSYPAIAAKMPNPPSLEEFLANAEKRMAARAPSSGESASATADEFLLAEDRAVKLAKLLGIPDGAAVDSYRYLVKGEGAPGSLTLVRAEGERSVSVE